MTQLITGQPTAPNPPLVPFPGSGAKTMLDGDQSGLSTGGVSFTMWGGIGQNGDTDGDPALAANLGCQRTNKSGDETRELTLGERELIGACA